MSKATTKLEAISYGRFSSKPQEEGSSIERQEAGYKSVLSRYPDKLVESTRYGFGRLFVKGRSAFHGDGAHLDELLGLIRSGEIAPGKAVIVIDEWSRFSRLEPDIAVGKLSEIVRKGIPVVIASPDMWVDAASISSPQFAMIGMCLQQVHQASADKSRHLKHARQKMRETGKTKHGKKLASCPFWLRVNEAGEYELIPEMVRIVKEMFRLASLGYGCEKIAELLGNPTRDCGKKGIRKIAVQRVLRNDAVIGLYHPATRNGKNQKAYTGETKDIYPHVISETLWHTVQAGLDTRKSQRGRKGKFVTNLFPELFRGSDGLPMHIKVMSGNRKYGTKDTKYLRRKTAGKTNGPFRTFDYAKIENALLRFLRELRLVGTVDSPLEDYQNEQGQLQKKLAELSALMEEYPSAATGKALQNTEAKLAILAEKIEVENQRIPESTSLDQTQEIIAALAKATGDDLLELRTRLKMLIRRLVSRIDVAYTVSEKGHKVCRLWVHLERGEKRLITITTGKAKHLPEVEFNQVCDTNGKMQEVWRVKTA